MTQFTYAKNRFSFGANPPSAVSLRNGGWEPDETGWHTVDPRIARHYREYADKRALRQLSRIFIERVDLPASVLTWPAHLAPKNYQRFAALFALERNRSYLGCDMGTGKTVMAALVINALPTHHVVYVCPPYLVETVAEEFRKWCPERRVWTPDNFSDGEGSSDSAVFIFPDSQIHTQKLRDIAANVVNTTGRPSSLIVDESHRFKSLTSRRTRALFQAYVPAFRHIVFMSGTPMPNRPFELWPVLSECAPETIDFMSEVEYGQKYCGGRYEEGRGWNFNFASKTEELAARVHDTFMLRLRKADVLPELPPKVEELVIVGRDLPPQVAELDAQILRAASPEDLVAAALAPMVDHTEETLPLATYRRLLGTLKARAAVPFIRGVLEDTNDNLLVFAFHSEAIEILAGGLADYQSRVIVGGTPAHVRKEMVYTFQHGASRILIANYIAGGIGWDLTKADRVIFVEASWNPADNQQASDRPHRIGRGGCVLVQYLCYVNSVDRRVMEVNMRKIKHTRHM